MPLFLKGYKLEMSKISQTFNVQPPDTPDTWVISIISTIPRYAYKYIGNGYEPDGALNVMIVMETGRDEKELMRTPVTISESKTLADVARRVCVPAIWPCWDNLDSPSKFWGSWEGAASLLEWNREAEKERISLEIDHNLDLPDS